MEVSLTHRSFKAGVWNFMGLLISQLFSFIIGIILARILKPSDYGLISMAMVFIAISYTFMDSGFSASLIRKKDVSKEDYSTVFYINIFFALICYALLFLFAPNIADFYQKKELVLIIRLASLNFIFAAISNIHSVILTKKLDFKSQSIINIVAIAFAGTVGIICSYFDFGVMSLLVQLLLQGFLSSLLLWVIVKWRPMFCFSLKSLKGLFSFGGKIFLSSLLNRIFENLYPLIIGRFFSSSQLGYYTRAESYQSIFSRNLTNMVANVSFPSLVEIQDDNERLKAGLSKINKLVSFINFPMMIGLIVLAEPIIKFTITDKWLPVVPYLQILCIVGMLYPIHVVNLSILNAKGRSDLFLYLEIIKKILVLISIIIGINWGVFGLIIGQVLLSVIALIINTYFTGRLLGYNLIKQIIDITPVFILSSIMGIVLFATNYITTQNDGLKLLIQFFCGVAVYIGIAYLFNFSSLVLLKELIEKKKNNK